MAGGVQSIAVYCGSKDGKNPEYREAASRLGSELGKQGLQLVYGGGNVGLMGAVAEAAFESGAKVTGVIPEGLVSVEVSGNTVGEQIVVKDMHERKAKMSELADAFIALPGGFGTLEELVEMITWQQLGFHSKPIGVLNVAGYYSPLLELVKHCTEEGFISQIHSNIVLSDDDPAKLLRKINEYTPPESLVEIAKRKTMSRTLSSQIG